MLLPRLLENPDKTLPQWFRTSPELQAGEADAKVRLWGGQAVDLMHVRRFGANKRALTGQISAKGHALLAQLVILYLQRQLAALAPSRSLATWGRLSAPQLRVSSKKVVPHVCCIPRRCEKLTQTESTLFAIRSSSSGSHACAKMSFSQLWKSSWTSHWRGRRAGHVHWPAAQRGFSRMVSIIDPAC